MNDQSHGKNGKNLDYLHLFADCSSETFAWWLGTFRGLTIRDYVTGSQSNHVTGLRGFLPKVLTGDTG